MTIFNTLMILTLSLGFTTGCSFFGGTKGKKRSRVAGDTAEAIDADATATIENSSSDDAGPGGDTGEDKPPPVVPAASDVQAADNTLANSLPESQYGIRSGSQYYNTLLAVTGVNKSQNLDNTYNGLKSALSGPAVLTGFDAARQSAIIKLATAVCDALVDDQNLRATFYPGIDFSQGVSSLSDVDKMAIATASTTKFWGDQNIGMDAAAVNASIVTLINNLSADINNPNNAQSTQSIVKGVCSAVAGSFQTIVI